MTMYTPPSLKRYIILYLKSPVCPFLIPFTFCSPGVKLS